MKSNIGYEMKTDQMGYDIMTIRFYFCFRFVRCLVIAYNIHEFSMTDQYLVLIKTTCLYHQK
jgi:hypothetical protein